MNPPEELFPGVKWEWELGRWRCWVGDALCFCAPSKGSAYRTGDMPVVVGPSGPEAIPWLREKVIAHLRSLVAPTGMRLVTVEQLEELARSSRQVEATIGGKTAPIHVHKGLTDKTGDVQRAAENWLKTPCPEKR